MDKLILSDDKVFYTIEGEGALVGTPSVFMRLAGCNLTCKGFKSEASPHGCDSYISWSQKNVMTFEQIYEEFFKGDLLDKLIKGAVLKLTGGEPLIQQKALLKFVDFLSSKVPDSKYKQQIRIDIETNGTITPDEQWLFLSNDKVYYEVSFTVSPKLPFSGDPVDKTFKPKTLSVLRDYLSCFKFVVRDEKDVQYIIDNYIEKDPYLASMDVYLMPCCGSRSEHEVEGRKVAELCKKYNFNFSPRLQLVLYNKALKV